MSDPARPSPPWPATTAQQRLLAVALAEGDAATVSTWEAVRRAGGLESVDAESFRLLPMVARRLSEAGYRDDDSDRLRGIVKRSWVANRWLLDRSLPVVDALTAAGIVPVVLKGAALAATVYPDLASRPFHDLDLLVSPRQLDQSLEALFDDGWELGHPRPGLSPGPAVSPSFRRFRHAADLVHPEGGAVDLHWHLVPSACWDDAEQGLLRRTRPFTLEGRSVSTLDATDHVLHSVLHGTTWSPVPSVRWFLDVALLARSGVVEWDALPDRAAELGCLPALRVGLEALACVGVDVPVEVRSATASRRVGRLDEYWFAHRVKDFSGRLSSREVLAEAARHVRSSRGAGAVAMLTGGPRFLQYLWYLDSASQVPAAALSKVAHRVGVGSRSSAKAMSSASRRP